MNIHSNTVLRTTRRMEWLDISRVFCMLIIIYMHFPWGDMNKMPADLFMCGAVPFYFFWAGYFCARSPQWNRLWKRSLQFFILFLIWELIAWLTGYRTNSNSSFFGISRFFVSNYSLCLEGNYPYIGPLWFVRDLIFLTLITPLLLQFRKLLIGLLIFLMSYQSLSFAPEPETALSIGSVAVYAIGCYSQHYQIAEKIQNIPLKYVALFLIGVGILSILVAWKNNNLNGTSWLSMPWRPTIFGLLTGVSLFTSIGLLLSSLFSRFLHTNYVHILSSQAPALLFVLIVHYPLGKLIFISVWAPNFFQAPILMLLCLFCYHTLNKVFPNIMPYLAYKGKIFKNS